MSMKLILIVCISAAVVVGMFVLGKMADGKDEEAASRLKN